MTTLVTGATGFVGSRVARALLAEGRAVRATVRPGSDRRNLDGLGVEVVEADLGDAASLMRAVDGCDAVYHVAADYRLWVPEPASIYRTNVEGTRMLLRAAGAAGVRAIVYTSSVATLGLPADGTPGDEETPVSLEDMVGHYKRSKFLAERAALALAREEGLPVVVVNPSASVGPGDIKPTPTGRMVLDAANGRMPAYVDTGLNIVHVDDVARGHLLAERHGRRGECYVLGGENMSLEAILREIAAITGRAPPTLRLPHAVPLAAAWFAEAWARISGATPSLTVDGARLARKHMYFSSARAARELGYRARPAAEALADAVAWFRERGQTASR
jgi:dihydroflavonol-4-reductase